jgi:hypothetical protein
MAGCGDQVAADEAAPAEIMGWKPMLRLSIILQKLRNWQNNYRETLLLSPAFNLRALCGFV